MEVRKLVWAKPALVRKPVQETMGGIGNPRDGGIGEFPTQS